MVPKEPDKCVVCKESIEEKDRVVNEETGDPLHAGCLIKYVINDLSHD